jgi:hypothetical protein
MDVQVYFHAKDQFLDLSGRLGNKIYLGKRHETQITVQDAFQLEYKNVHNGIILYESDRKCSYKSYDSCMYQALTKAMVLGTEDKCTVPWVPYSDRRYVSRICTKSNDINTTFWIAWSRITNQKGDCLKPCHTTLINVGTKNELNNEENGYAQLYAYFSSNVVQSREHYFITILKLAGQIGGYIGLFRMALTLLNLAKCDKLTEGVSFIRKSEENIKVHDEERNAENGDDALIGLAPLAINANSFRVIGN